MRLRELGAAGAEMTAPVISCCIRLWYLLRGARVIFSLEPPEYLLA
jgi:hypothetical protein